MFHWMKNINFVIKVIQGREGSGGRGKTTITFTYIKIAYFLATLCSIWVLVTIRLPTYKWLYYV